MAACYQLIPSLIPWLRSPARRTSSAALRVRKDATCASSDLSERVNDCGEKMEKNIGKTMVNIRKMSLLKYNGEYMGKSLTIFEYTIGVYWDVCKLWSVVKTHVVDWHISYLIDHI